MAKVKESKKLKKAIEQKAELSTGEVKVYLEPVIEIKVSIDEHIGMGLTQKSSSMQSDLEKHPKFSKFITNEEQ